VRFYAEMTRLRPVPRENVGMNRVVEPGTELRRGEITYHRQVGPQKELKRRSLSLIHILTAIAEQLKLSALRLRSVWEKDERSGTNFRLGGRSQDSSGV